MVIFALRSRKKNAHYASYVVRYLNAKRPVEAHLATTSIHDQTLVPTSPPDPPQMPIRSVSDAIIMLRFLWCTLFSSQLGNRNFSSFSVFHKPFRPFTTTITSLIIIGHIFAVVYCSHVLGYIVSSPILLCLDCPITIPLFSQPV